MTRMNWAFAGLCFWGIFMIATAVMSFVLDGFAMWTPGFWFSDFAANSINDDFEWAMQFLPQNNFGLLIFILGSIVWGALHLYFSFCIPIIVYFVMPVMCFGAYRET